MKVTVNEATTSINCGENNRPVINAKLIPFAKLSEPSSGMAVASDGNKIAFAGASLAGNPPNYGSSVVHILDIRTQSWSTAALSFSRADVAAVAAGNKIFFAGGRLGNGGGNQYFSTVDIYDVSTGRWSVANLSQARASAAAATVGDKVLFAGGEQEWPRPVSDRVDIYDLKTDEWSTASLSVPRNGLAAVTANQKVYFAGGANQIGGTNNVSDIIDIYDNTVNSWSTTTLSEPKAFFAGINVYNKIYWAGGYGALNTPSCEVEIRNLSTQASSRTSLFHPFSYVAHEGLNPVVKNNKIIWFATLDPSNGNSTDKFNIYDITTNTWSIGLLPVRMNGASVMSINNIVYIAGGFINGRMSDQVWKLEF
jgi:N-acetylneuraminic acid mutarotase